MITDVNYKLAYAIIRNAEVFHGQIVIEFNLEGEPSEEEPLFVTYGG